MSGVGEGENRFEHTAVEFGMPSCEEFWPGHLLFVVSIVPLNEDWDSISVLRLQKVPVELQILAIHKFLIVLKPIDYRRREE